MRYGTFSEKQQEARRAATSAYVHAESKMGRCRVTLAKTKRSAAAVRVKEADSVLRRAIEFANNVSRGLYQADAMAYP